jgi:hypothetical protein
VPACSSGACHRPTYNRYEYTNDPTVNRTVPLEGTYYLTADGTAEMPIAIRAAGDGEVIFDGAGNFNLFNVKAADYTYFEGITFRNTEIAIWAGTQFITGSKGLTVKRSRFEDVGMGVFTNYSGSSNFYIADNYFYGRNDPERGAAAATAVPRPPGRRIALQSSSQLMRNPVGWRIRPGGPNALHASTAPSSDCGAPLGAACLPFAFNGTLAVSPTGGVTIRPRQSSLTTDTHSTVRSGRSARARVGG